MDDDYKISLTQSFNFLSMAMSLEIKDRNVNTNLKWSGITLSAL